MSANNESESKSVFERVINHDEVEDRKKALQSAMLASDVTKLSLLIDDALVYTGPGGAVLGKCQDLSAPQAGILSISKLTLFDRRLHRIGENVLVTTKTTLAGAFAGSPIDGTYAYTRLWSRASDNARDRRTCSTVDLTRKRSFTETFLEPDIRHFFFECQQPQKAISLFWVPRPATYRGAEQLDLIEFRLAKRAKTSRLRQSHRGAWRQITGL